MNARQFRFLLSLVGSDSEYQRHQALQAEAAARRLGVILKTLYAQRDAITQSQQLLDVIQSKAADKPDAIIFEPVSETGLPQVARAAVEAGIGWGILNLRAEYLPKLRAGSSCVVFGIGADHLEIGRIQGRQLAKLLPRGGDVLMVQGPSDNAASQQRTQGMQEAKPDNINLRQLKAKWTEESGYHSVVGFLALSTSRNSNIQGIVAQNDRMALGAKRAFLERTTGVERDRWLSLPFLGCDGLPESGEAWVPTRKLTATVVVPANAPLAIEMFVDAFTNGKRPPEYSLTASKSFPDIPLLKEVGDF
jgi:ABC-type sugar transport system substrate-binding protein